MQVLVFWRNHLSADANQAALTSRLIIIAQPSRHTFGLVGFAQLLRPHARGSASFQKVMKARRIQPVAFVLMGAA